MKFGLERLLEAPALRKPLAGRLGLLACQGPGFLARR